MTEKELIRIALESRLPDTLGHKPSDIIEAEAKGAQAHIRRRRFAFVGIAAAAALVIGASVFGFKKLSEIKIDRSPTAPDSSLSSQAEDTDDGSIIKLCDFTGKKENANISLTRTPANLNGTEVKITDFSVKAGDLELLGGNNSYNAVIKVYSADVTGDGYADICVESKPTFYTEDSVVYLFDLRNDQAMTYYVPDSLCFCLKEENNSLMLGMFAPGSSETEYVPADFTVPARYLEAQKAWFGGLIENIKENTSEAKLTYICQDGVGRNNLGDGICYDRSVRLENTLDGKAATDTLAALLSGGDEAAAFEPDLGPTAINSEDRYAFSVNKEILTAILEKDGKRICTFNFYTASGGEQYLSAEVNSEKGADHSAGFIRSGGSAVPLRSAVQKDSGGAAVSASAQTTYYCEDINALGNTSSAQRMLISQKGSFAVSYHIETVDGTGVLAVDSVQPEWLTGTLTVGSDGSGVLTALDFEGRSAAGQWLTIPGGSSALGQGLTVSFRCEDKAHSDALDTATDRFVFGDTGYKKEFVYLADLTWAGNVTRLNSGEQIRFERRPDALPGTAVSITDSSVTVTDAGGIHTLAEGVRVLRVFASDLNEDGKPEIIAEVCKTDQVTDGDILVFEPVSAEVTSISQSFYNSEGVWLDSVRSYLSVLRYQTPEEDIDPDDPKPADRPYAQDVALKTILRSLDSDSMLYSVLEDLDALEQENSRDPSRVKYTFTHEEYYRTSEGTYDYWDESYEGELHELPEISALIKEAIENGECKVLTMGENEYPSNQLAQINLMIYRESREYDYDNNVITLEYYPDGFFCVQTGESYVVDLKTVVMLQLPESLNQPLMKLIYDDGPAFESITRDGTPYSVNDLIPAEELEEKGAEFTSLNDLVKVKYRVKFDLPNKKMTVYTDKIETAPGISAERSEISLEIFTETGSGGENNYKANKDPKPGSVSELDYSRLSGSGKMLIEARINYSVILKLPDGTNREVNRPIMCRFVNPDEL